MPTPDEVQASFRREADRIRSNKGFSDAGKRTAMARAYRNHKDALERLRQEDASKERLERNKLTKDLFGIDRLASFMEPASGRAALSVSFRDAQDRVAGVEKEDAALALLARAERSGDDILARAIVERGLAEGWLDVLNTYAAAHPGTEAKLQRLVDMDNNSPTTIARQLSEEMKYALGKPTEIAGLSDRDIEDITVKDSSPTPTLAGTLSQHFA